MMNFSAITTLVLGEREEDGKISRCPVIFVQDCRLQYLECIVAILLKKSKVPGNVMS